MNYDYDRQREEEQIAAVLAFNVKGLLLTESVHTLRADSTQCGENPRRGGDGAGGESGAYQRGL